MRYFTAESMAVRKGTGRAHGTQDYGGGKGFPRLSGGHTGGNELLSIGGETIIDTIDYQALTAPGRLTVKTRKGEYHIKKAEYADLGLEFSTGMMSGVRMCCNKCMFCFVDQLPCYARDSLRVKDDDSRVP